MDDSVQVFPRNETEALALLYVQAQNMAGASHKEFYDKYSEALSEFQKLTKPPHRKQKLTY